MPNLIVNSISGVAGTTVDLSSGISGQSFVSEQPRVLNFDPPTNGKKYVSSIILTFNQRIEFSGVGTIYVREGSSSGTIATSFTCGVSAGATISGETLSINLSEPLSGIGNTYYVTLPSVGIANTYGQYYSGTEDYFFTNEDTDFSSTVGGNIEFIQKSSDSPTGYWKYHIFTSPGILTATSPTGYASSVTALLVGGGGGGGGDNAPPVVIGSGGGAGGLLYFDGSNKLLIPSGQYTVTVGYGGTIRGTPTFDGSNGGDSSLVGSNPFSQYQLLTAIGGGGGGGSAPTSIGGQPGGSGGGNGGGNGGQGLGSDSGLSYFYGSNGSPAKGGGGGAGGNGVDSAPAPAPASGNGGDGLLINEFTASSIGYAFADNFPGTASRDAVNAGYFAAGGGSEDGTPGLGGDLIGIYNGSGGAGGNTSSGSDGNSGVFILRYEYTKS